MMNDWKEYTTAQLVELLKETEERLERLNNAPPNLYIVGYGDTYLSAMSQVWGIKSCKEEIREIKSELRRRQ